MSLLSSMAFALSSLMKRNPRSASGPEEVMRMETVTVTLPSSIRRTEEAKLPLEQQAKPQSPEIIDITGTSTYTAFRRFLFKSTYSQATRELIQNSRILIERDGNPGRIYVEADGKSTLYQAENGIRIISARHVVGIIFHSRSGKTELYWRDNKPAGKIWGHVTRKSLAMLLSCNIHLRRTEKPASSPA